jgi:hypothetical protein
MRKPDSDTHLPKIESLLKAATFFVCGTKSGAKSPAVKGTAFLISPRGYLLTAGHLIQPRSQQGHVTVKDSQNGKPLGARVVRRIFDASTQLDYAVLIVEGAHLSAEPLPLYPHESKSKTGHAHVCGLNPDARDVEFVPSVPYKGSLGNKKSLLLRLESENIIDGYSGAAAFDEKREDVFAVLVAGLHCTRSVHYALPIHRIAEDWPPLLDILANDGSLVPAEGQTCEQMLEEHRFVQEGEVLDEALVNAILERVSALTGPKELSDDHLKCARSSRGGRYTRSGRLCSVGLVSLWLTAELKRSKTITERVRKCISFLKPIFETIEIVYPRISAEKLQVVPCASFMLIKEKIKGLEGVFTRSLDSKKDEDEAHATPWYGRLARFLERRCGLGAEQMMDFGKLLETTKLNLESIPPEYEKIEHAQNLAWKKFLEIHRVSLAPNLLGFLSQSQVLRNLESVLDGLIRDTRHRLCNAFSVVGEKPPFPPGRPIELVIRDAALSLPQNSEESPTLNAWPAKLVFPTNGGSRDAK